MKSDALYFDNREPAGSTIVIEPLGTVTPDLRDFSLCGTSIMDFRFPILGVAKNKSKIGIRQHVPEVSAMGLCWCL